MTENEFERLARAGYNRIPITRELPADLDTPLAVYLKLANAPYSCLLESVVGGERFGRYSIIGLPARTVLRVHGHIVTLETDGEKTEQHTSEDPLEFIATMLARYRVAKLSGLPRFSGGLAGYFGYDTVRYIEKRLAHCHKPDLLNTPDILLLLTEELAVVDNLTGKLTLIVYANPEEPGAYARATERLKQLRSDLRKPLVIPQTLPTVDTETERETSKTDYLKAVALAKKYIAAGDMMQVQIGQRLIKPYPASALSLYRALRSINPSPYMYYYDMGNFHVVGASPEILVRQEQRADGNYVTIRPLAGTRPRGDTPQRDQELAAELLADPKELAEHLMLIDLARNDIGRIAQTGTVAVTDKMVVERYSHVMHIVSSVEGKLKPDTSNLDVLRATFPAGTLTGAPKIRAMEIIDELEPSKRGLYGGAVGYLGFNGEMDLAIAIRTGIVKNGKLYVQAAAGIVADSVAESEWQETENKARAVLRAAEIVLSEMEET
ncbi:MAG TPA: anthranilate synthase component I [Burkholderiales bacterium]|nr:anthranilate synthase component I [Burkholderiales bacterium]